MNGELILVVEDDEKSRKLIRDLLAVKGYRLIEAASAEEGIRLAREKQPSLIVMDIRLPKMSGFEAVEHLQQHAETRHIPVIALTASAMPEDRKRILNGAFRAYHSKPINVREFLSIVADVLGGDPTTVGRE